MPSRRPFLAASEPVVLALALNSRDFQSIQRIQQARGFAYQSPASTELRQSSFPRTRQLFQRHPFPTSPTRSLANSTVRLSARTVTDRRSYFHTRNKEVISKMGSQGKRFLHRCCIDRRTNPLGTQSCTPPTIHHHLGPRPQASPSNPPFHLIRPQLPHR